MRTPLMLWIWTIGLIDKGQQVSDMDFHPTYARGELHIQFLSEQQAKPNSVDIAGPYLTSTPLSLSPAASTACASPAPANLKKGCPVDVDGPMSENLSYYSELLKSMMHDSDDG